MIRSLSPFLQHHVPLHLSRAWSRTTASSSSLAFVFVTMLFLALQLTTHIWARSTLWDARNFLQTLTDIPNFIPSFDVLVPDGPLLSCIDIPPLGETFMDYCNTIWSPEFAAANPLAFQGLETTVPVSQATTVFQEVAAKLETAGPLVTPPSILAHQANRKKRPPQPHRPTKGHNQKGHGGDSHGPTVTVTVTETVVAVMPHYTGSAAITFPIGFLPPGLVPHSTSAHTSKHRSTTGKVMPTPSASPQTIGSFTSLDDYRSRHTAPCSSVQDLPILPAPTPSVVGTSTIAHIAALPTITTFASPQETPSELDMPLSTIKPVPSPGNSITPQGSGVAGLTENHSSASPGKLFQEADHVAHKNSPSQINHILDSQGVLGDSGDGDEGKNEKSDFALPQMEQIHPAGISSHGGTTTSSTKKPVKSKIGRPHATHKAKPKGSKTKTKQTVSHLNSFLRPRRTNVYNPSNSSFTTRHNGRLITITPQFNEITNSSSLAARFSSMKITGLTSAPQGQTDVIFIYDECVRSLLWGQQTLTFTLEENSITLAWFVWLALIQLIAVWGESVSFIITAWIGAPTSIVLVVLQLYQLLEFEKEFKRAIADGACGGVDLLSSLPQQLVGLRVCSIATSVVSGVFVSFLGWRLFKAYNHLWRRTDIIPRMKRPLAFRISLNVAFQLAWFFMSTTAVLWLGALFCGTPATMDDDQKIEEALFSAFHALVFPWLVLGVVASQFSLCRMTLVFIGSTLGITVGWGFLFAVDLYRVFLSTWQFMAIMPIICATLTVAILILSIIYRLDYTRGLQGFIHHRQTLSDKPTVSDEEKADNDTAGMARRSAAPTVHFHPDALQQEQTGVPSVSLPQDQWTPRVPRLRRLTNQSMSDNQSTLSWWTPSRLRAAIANTRFGRNSGTVTARSSSFYPESTIPETLSGVIPPSLPSSLNEGPFSPHFSDSSADDYRSKAPASKLGLMRASMPQLPSRTLQRQPTVIEEQYAATGRVPGRFDYGLK